MARGEPFPMTDLSFAHRGRSSTGHWHRVRLSESRPCGSWKPAALWLALTPQLHADATPGGIASTLRALFPAAVCP